jgi:hypothetical protein
VCTFNTLLIRSKIWPYVQTWQCTRGIANPKRTQNAQACVKPTCNKPKPTDTKMHQCYVASAHILPPLLQELDSNALTDILLLYVSACLVLLANRHTKQVALLAQTQPCTNAYALQQQPSPIRTRYVKAFLQCAMPKTSQTDPPHADGRPHPITTIPATR